MVMSLALKVFGHKSEYWTNFPKLRLTNIYTENSMEINNIVEISQSGVLVPTSLEKKITTFIKYI